MSIIHYFISYFILVSRLFEYTELKIFRYFGYLIIGSVLHNSVKTLKKFILSFYEHSLHKPIVYYGTNCTVIRAKFKSLYM